MEDEKAAGKPEGLLRVSAQHHGGKGSGIVIFYALLSAINS